MEEQQDLLLDAEEQIYLERASAGLRFANFIIDVIVLRVIGYLLGLVMTMFFIELLTNIFDGMGYWEIFMISYLFGLIPNFVYYTIMEGATKGRTIGKFVTRTRAVMNNGQPISMQTAALRSLCRLIPFEPFSAFSGYPWHDSLTNTQVVEIKRY